MTQNDRSQTVRLTTATKKRLEAVRDLLEEAIQEQFSEGLAPGVRSPKISQSYTIGAALDMLAGVVADRIEVYPAGAVQHLMAESGRMIANGRRWASIPPASSSRTASPGFTGRRPIQLRSWLTFPARQQRRERRWLRREA